MRIRLSTESVATDTVRRIEEKFGLLSIGTGYEEMAHVLIERVNRLERLERVRQSLTPLRQACGFSGEEHELYA